MAIIHIDGKSVEVDGADNLLQACLSLGIDVPYFCYHPALGSVGSCRQCAVKQYNNKDDYEAGRGRLVMSCMVNPTEDMYISVSDDEVKKFRKSLVEYIMTNHPHDCPTCEEGGHCHLQDMTYMSGHNKRRYRFTKRVHHNQDLGAFINHEMNRCIACYRCVRFYKDYAGGGDMGVYASNNRVYFGRDKDGQFESEFSGNLTEVCPTGVFTDKTHSQRYNRKWDMQYAPSICHGCSTGCNISAGERYGELRRIENRFNGDVNAYFLCDRGRFGYGYVNRSDRHVQAVEKIGNDQEKVSIDFAIEAVKKRIMGKKVLGIGSPVASLESNFALKHLVGDANFSTGVGKKEQDLVQKCIEILTTEDTYNPTLREIECYDAILILGEDLTQTSPRVALAVRQAAKNKAKEMANALRTPEWLAEPVKRIGQNACSPIFIVDVKDTKLDDIAAVSCVATPRDIAKLGFEIANQMAILDTKQLPKDLTIDVADNSDMKTFAKHIAQTLLKANRPLIISGTSLNSTAIIEAAAQIAYLAEQKRSEVVAHEKTIIDAHNTAVDVEIAKINEQKAKQKQQDDIEQKAEVALPKHMQATIGYKDKADIYLTVPKSNSIGVNLLGGLSLEAVLDSDAEAVIILENDLKSRLSNEQFNQLIGNKAVIVLDHENYPWHRKADVILPVATFAEADGTLVSAEGRAQRFFQVYDPVYYNPHNMVKESWRWLHAIECDVQGRSIDWTQLDDVVNVVADVNPALQGIKDASPTANFRISGLKIAREPRRYSGRTAMRAPISVHEPEQPKDIDTALTFSQEGYVGTDTPSAMIPFAWAAGWNSPQAWNKYQGKVGTNLKNGDPGVRLFDRISRLPKREYVAPNFDEVIPATQNATTQLVPIYNIFASDNLASRSEVVASQLIEPVFSVCRDDAKIWQLQAGDILTVKANHVVQTLPVKLVDYLAEGCIGYPVGQVPELTAELAKDDVTVSFAKVNLSQTVTMEAL
ncbi:NADH dehydrogenase subunit G [Moraxella macacae 0408225]|uniref:NADH-quinone oxidoreductase n=1 Tax=Moraxella macacae 0408225 TaxID=1230338 RepID=L2F8I0_9GAMM|nr:NADH-quinone oxidoreductase subunit NuoG [Moraxella macacae]ELA08778.1 NADH dehydrogenase subunit G [Moraxella macacae 0408225]